MIIVKLSPSQVAARRPSTSARRVQILHLLDIIGLTQEDMKMTLGLDLLLIAHQVPLWKMQSMGDIQGLRGRLRLFQGLHLKQRCQVQLVPVTYVIWLAGWCQDPQRPKGP